MIGQDRPLCFFDLEATGVNTAEDRIVEICIIRREVDGSEKTLSTLVDPECPIPPESSEVHHISDEDVKGKPTFKQLAPQVLEILDGADLAGYNIKSFDVPMLAAEIKRAGVEVKGQKRRIVDAYLVFKRQEPHNLATAARFYCGLVLGEEAHRADADVRATMAVVDAQAEHYEDLPRSVAGIDAWLAQKDPRFVDFDGKFRWAAQEAVCAFGKNNGKTLRYLAMKDRSFLEWMLRSQFSRDTLDVVRKALAGEFPMRPQEADQQQ